MRPCPALVISKDLDSASASAQPVAPPHLSIGNNGKRIHAIASDRFDFHITRSFNKDDVRNKTLTSRRRFRTQLNRSYSLLMR
jgi:hypothetical protein